MKHTKQKLTTQTNQTHQMKQTLKTHKKQIKNK